MSSANDEILISIYRNMVRTRALDDKIDDMIARGFRIVQHPTTGQEATPIAACAHLREDDYVMPYHRGWAWAIGKGMEPKAILAELIGKETGCCRGKGGPHLADFNLGILGRSGIQAAHIPIAAGVALSAKMRKSGQVIVCFFGNGASNEGNFHEGLNLAAVWKAPVVYVCENNLYALFSPLLETTAVENIADRAASYGIPGVIVDGNDAEEVYDAAGEAMERARNGEGPTLIESNTYRLRGHTAMDRFHYGGYRDKSEVDSWAQKDPILLLQKKLLERGVASEVLREEIENEAKQEMDEAEKFATESKFPSPESILSDVYA